MFFTLEIIKNLKKICFLLLLMSNKLKKIIKASGLVSIVTATSLYASKCVADYAYSVKELPVNSAFNYRETLRTDHGGSTYDDGLGVALGGLVGLCVAGSARVILALAKLNSGLEDRDK